MSKPSRFFLGVLIALEFALLASGNFDLQLAALLIAGGICVTALLCN